MWVVISGHQSGFVTHVPALSVLAPGERDAGHAGLAGPALEATVHAQGRNHSSEILVNEAIGVEKKTMRDVRLSC